MTVRELKAKAKDDQLFVRKMIIMRVILIDKIRGRLCCSLSDTIFDSGSLDCVESFERVSN